MLGAQGVEVVEHLIAVGCVRRYLVQRLAGCQILLAQFGLLVFRRCPEVSAPKAASTSAGRVSSMNRRNSFS